MASRSPPLLLLLLVSVLLLLHAPPASTQPTTAPAPAPAADADFIRESCNATLYPDICYRSLSPYASSISQDPAQIARIAVGVSLSQARLAADHFSNLSFSHDFGEDTRASSALQDCCSTFSDAVSQTHGSFKRMSRLGSAGGGSLHSLRFQLSDVQTWMSAALTNENTCTDGFSGVSDGPLKSDVCNRAAKVRALTSNALALVDTYASTVS